MKTSVVASTGIVMTATYDPTDNRLRLRASARLDAETYAKVKAAGFRWAPRQELFVAPMWTPERADLLVELCGEIEDEDTSLVDRAEERSERFGEYAGKRAADAQSAHAAVSRVADGIPLGQPILVGHHSEKRARRDAEKIENGMRRAVKMWETSRYWEQRAKGALAAAKYKELPAVRYRRIRGLEADKRKYEKEIREASLFLSKWRAEGLTREQALGIANFDHTNTWGDLHDGKITVEQAAERATARHEHVVAHYARWLAHVDGRLAYERAMLGEQGGDPGAARDYQVGGRVLNRWGEWCVVSKVNRDADKRVVSVTAIGSKYGRCVIDVERVQDYRPPAEGDAAKVKAATKLGPIVNYPGEGFAHKTTAEWKERYHHISRRGATEKHGAHRVRVCYRNGDSIGVYLTDAKRVDPPAPTSSRTTSREEVAEMARETALAAESDVELEIAKLEARNAARELRATEDAPYEAIKKSLKGGVQVVSAPQLFPTSRKLVERMMAEAEIESGHRVLEPEAGTGAIVEVLVAYAGVEVVANEINLTLARRLEERFPDVDVHAEDFLACTDLGIFDRIVMNPPFERGADIAHVEHALTMLRPGGRCVALVADGPRQNARLRQHARVWDSLGDAFREQGTGVRVALAVFDAPVGA